MHDRTQPVPCTSASLLGGDSRAEVQSFMFCLFLLFSCSDTTCPGAHDFVPVLLICIGKILLLVIWCRCLWLGVHVVIHIKPRVGAGPDSTMYKFDPPSFIHFA